MPVKGDLLPHLICSTKSAEPAQTRFNINKSVHLLAVGTFTQMLKRQATASFSLLFLLALGQILLVLPVDGAPPSEPKPRVYATDLTLPEIFQLKREGLDKAAQSSIERYLVKHPDDADALMFKCYYLTTGTHRSQLYKILEKLISQKKRLVDAYRLRSNLYYQDGKYELALKDLDTVIPMDATSDPLYHLRAFTYERLNRKKEADADRLRHKCVHPLNRTWNKMFPSNAGIKPMFNSRTTFANAYSGGQAVMDRFDINAAAEYFNKAVALDPTSLAARFYRATIFESLEKNAEAIKDCDYIIATGAKSVSIPLTPLDTRNKNMSAWPALVLPIAEVYRRKARCHYALEQCKEMLASVKMVVAGEPEEATAWEVMADMCTGCNMHATALEAYRKMELLDPNNREILLRMAACYDAIKNYKKAVEMLTYVIRLNPKDETLYEHRATALSRMGRSKEAIDDLTIMISRAPESPEAYMRRAAEYEKLNDYKSALADYSKAIDLDPYRKLSYENRARVLFKLGKPDLANKDKTRALTIVDR